MVRPGRGSQAVEVGHVALIFEVFHGAHAPHEAGGAHAVGQVYGQVVVGHHRDAVVAGIEVGDGCGAPLGVVTVVFGAVHAHADDQAVEQRQCAPHDVVVADGEWVERPGE